MIRGSSCMRLVLRRPRAVICPRTSESRSGPGSFVTKRSVSGAIGMLHVIATGCRKSSADKPSLSGVRWVREDQPVSTGNKLASRVAAIVLNYRTPEQSILAVRSLQSSNDVPGHIIVVDNGSADGSAVLLRALDGITLLETGCNLGFSGGCNVGIRAALAHGAEHVLLVNSDVVLAPDAVGALLIAAQRNQDVGILGPLIASRENPARVASAGISYSLRTGRMRHLNVGRPITAFAGCDVREVDAVSGCVMLIRRGVVERAGLLQEDYFFSFEDIEFCLRARAAGFRTCCALRARACHEGGASIGRRSPRRVYFATRNHLKLAADIAVPHDLGRVLRSGFIVALNAAYVLTSPDAPLFAGLAGVARGTWHHVTGRYGAD
jgi:GT2 family glycosyltransferase